MGDVKVHNLLEQNAKKLYKSEQFLQTNTNANNTMFKGAAMQDDKAFISLINYIIYQ